MTDIDITINASFLPQDDPDAAVAFDRDTLGFEVVQEPTEQPYGIRDCAFRDPVGNLIASTSFAESVTPSPSSSGHTGVMM